ncbi:MAG: ABC transporter substrate-binding protein [Desulfobacterales bacterium]|nr:ABC transporter substrate-binding protein [Desulfobacterales bacterium]
MTIKKWIMRALLYAAFSLLILSQTVIADDKITAQEFLKSKLDSVFEVLQKEDLEQQAKNKAVIEIVTPMFDFALMAKLSLGKTHWPGLTKEKQDRFTELFVNRLRQSYLNKLTTYTDEEIIYEPPVEVKKKIHIPTRLISKGREISMLYKFYNSNNSWKVYDIEIQGVSIIRSYRSQFNEILQRGTMDDLFEKLEKSTES